MEPNTSSSLKPQQGKGTLRRVLTSSWFVPLAFFLVILAWFVWIDKVSCAPDVCTVNTELCASCEYVDMLYLILPYVAVISIVMFVIILLRKKRNKRQARGAWKRNLYEITLLASLSHGAFNGKKISAQKVSNGTGSDHWLRWRRFDTTRGRYRRYSSWSIQSRVLCVYCKTSFADYSFSHTCSWH